MEHLKKKSLAKINMIASLPRKNPARQAAVIIAVLILDGGQVVAADGAEPATSVAEFLKYWAS